MVGVGKIARDAWTQIFTLGKAPVSDMAQVCQQIEAIQGASTSGLPLSGATLTSPSEACDCRLAN
jgi:hypothetical protein